MSLELILDIALSVVVLVIYHSDCDRTTPAPVEPIAEVHVTSPEQYDHTIIPSSVPEPIDEWAIEDAPLVMESSGPAPIDYAAEWYAEMDKLINHPDTQTPYPCEVVRTVPLTPEAIEACTHWSTDPIEPTSLATYQDMSGRKLKAIAKELSIPGWSRMKQPQLAIAVHQAAIDRDRHPEG